MAPLRSSRHTRHTDAHGASTRTGRNANDFDPTDGLPVRKFVLDTISINQDAAAEATDPHAAQRFSKDGFPWPEQPLPTFFDQLPAHNQELLRRARAGERETKCSVWDKKTAEWVRYDEARKRGLTGDIGLRKSRYLMNVANEDGDENADVEDDDASNSGSDEEDAAPVEVPNELDGLKKGKKRKQPPIVLQDRTFEVKKWVQVPMDKADKMPEPKYLADRRTGMPNYYNQSAQGAWAHAQGYGGAADGGAGPGYDLGDGTGLGNALGGPGPNAGGDTPVRRNMPPRPKPKKKGGPGRKKKEVIEAERRAKAEAKRRQEALDRGEILEEPEPKAEDATAAAPAPEGTETPKAGGDDEESEGEGSEEGEVGDDTGTPGSTTPVPGAGAANSLNLPTIPSGLSQEVPATADVPVLEDAVPNTATDEPSLADSAPPALEVQMTDAPTISSLTADLPPPSAEPTVPETIVAAPAAEPLTPGEPLEPAADEVSVPFAPEAAKEVAPLVEGVEVPSTGARDGEDPAPQEGEVAGAAVDGGPIAVAAADVDVPEEPKEVAAAPEEVAGTKESEPSALDLLGGLERSVEDQSQD